MLATDCKLSLIREAGNNIRIYTPFTQYEWNLLKNSLDKKILRRVKFTIAPKACNDGISILLVDIEYSDFEEIFNILSSLFYDIKKIISNYTGRK